MTWKILPLLKLKPEENLERLTPLREETFSTPLEIEKITQYLATAILVGWLFNWLHLPVGWLLGSMIVGIAYGVIQGSSQPLPSAFMTVGKAIIGLGTAIRFSPETLSLSITYAVPMLMCIFITGSLSLFYGYLLGHWAGIDRKTSILAFIPGVASSIVAIGEEMGADAVTIGILQYLRLFLVVLIVPTLTNLFLPINLATQATATVVTASELSIPMYVNLMVLGVCCAVGIWGGKYLRLPAASFLGTFLIGLIVFWTLPYQLEVPSWLFACGLLPVGLSIGLKFDLQTAHRLWQAVLIEVGLVITLIIFCLVVGYVFHLVTQVDIVSAMLGFTPGGLEAMVATAIQMGADTGLVLAMQMTRMLIIIVLSPWLIGWVMKTADK